MQPISSSIAIPGGIRTDPDQAPQLERISFICLGMPRYFFHVYNRTAEVPDEEGTELPNAAAAHDHAVRGIRSLLSAEVLTGVMDLHGHLDIADAAGSLVERAQFSDAVSVRPA